MGKITARQTINAMVLLPIALMANAAQAVAADTAQSIEPNQKVSDFGDRLDFNMAVPTTTITIEESEDADTPDFSANNLDVEIDKIMTQNLQLVIEEPPPVVYLSAARGQQSRECNISAICE